MTRQKPRPRSRHHSHYDSYRPIPPMRELSSLSLSPGSRRPAPNRRRQLSGKKQGISVSQPSNRARTSKDLKNQTNTPAKNGGVGEQPKPVTFEVTMENIAMQRHATKIIDQLKQLTAEPKTQQTTTALLRLSRECLDTLSVYEEKSGSVSQLFRGLRAMVEELLSGTRREVEKGASELRSRICSGVSEAMRIATRKMPLDGSSANLKLQEKKELLNGDSISISDSNLLLTCKIGDLAGVAIALDIEMFSLDSDPELNITLSIAQFERVCGRRLAMPVGAIGGFPGIIGLEDGIGVEFDKDGGTMRVEATYKVN